MSSPKPLIQALAYVVAESTDVSRWRQYGEQVLGAMTSPAPEGGLYLKLDERRFRLAVVAGSEDRYQASGWEVANAADFAAAVAAIEKAGVKVEPASAALKAARCVTDLALFTDPSGNRHELGYGYAGGESPFVSPLGSTHFKTGAQGMGHTVLPSLNFDASLKFFTEVLGFGISDIFNFQPGPDAPLIRIYFLHAASGRHHSLALAEMPSPSGCVHIMLEVTEKDEVDRGELRREKHGAKLMATLGQHENDKMTSFYMLTPSNFALEYGWGGISVEPGVWETTHTKQVSIWGHDFSVGFR
ncbi:biphenyl 2,3-dioxygenase [Stagnimonas aquatica]|uniref:Biphenyl 2,3-dioxygenase n=1 Tax=Stagnimonas aquatica TaxID=2689987 RepID=A0A3N0VLD1_9GAMM|nr:VOC family protein [Stagnimonas aquatica]ROH93559.1 biphenyl 2,3-dioxygenase [Stagnimonas aquatica]